MKKERVSVRRIAVYGLLLALSLVLSYVEGLIPVNLGAPGAKLGLPNIVTMLALYCAGGVPAFLLGLLRIVLVGLSFGNPFAMFYSFCGFLLSFLGMLFLKRTGSLGIVAVSAAGGVLHNLGQLFCAAWLLKTRYIFTYLILLFPLGVLSGLFIGLLGGMLTKRLRRGILNEGIL